MRKAAALALLTSVAMLGFASMGGEKKKKGNSSITGNFTPIRTTSGFTLKSGPSYKGSLTFHQEKNQGYMVYNSLVTFQKGNTTYILPFNHKINAAKPNQASNLQLLKLKVRMHK
ncbi:hypothetical protein KJS94_07640 [Flavihumibacter rivuli]|uniref:hypothetical protein n=1 Tax=Flavihumibacter rivuli TaxID=2838156 RepID=UPI001BDE1C29|nr:hypothetical protein [Flavihumibacter rivuli]ULQ58073.1 hypothetical protein KJS94_07640 [Flavihumibacter rivuli]